MNDELELKKIPLMELETEFDKVGFDNLFEVNTDKQLKSFRCKQTGKNVSRYCDAVRHYFAKCFVPNTEREKEYVRACGGIV